MQWNLIILRKEQGLTQKEMAEIIGISEDGYRKKETGKTQFKQNEMFFIANYFNRAIEDIFTPNKTIE